MLERPQHPRTLEVVNATVVGVPENALTPLESSGKTGAIDAGHVPRALSLPERALPLRPVERADDRAFSEHGPTLLQHVRGEAARVHRPAVRDLMRHDVRRTEHRIFEASCPRPSDDEVV